MGVRDLMARVDARIYASQIVRAVMIFGTSELPGAFFRKPREVALAGGQVMGVGISFECQWTNEIGNLTREDHVTVENEGTFRFLRELEPWGDESGKTVIELGEVLS
jgi:hypothetical protein